MLAKCSSWFILRGTKSRSYRQLSHLSSLHWLQTNQRTIRTFITITAQWLACARWAWFSAYMLFSSHFNTIIPDYYISLRTVLHRMIWVGKDLKEHLIPIPLPWLFKAPSRLALNTVREGAPPASLGKLFRCFTTLTLKDFFHISNLNFPSFWTSNSLSYHCILFK